MPNLPKSRPQGQRPLDCHIQSLPNRAAKKPARTNRDKAPRLAKPSRLYPRYPGPGEAA